MAVDRDAVLMLHQSSGMRQLSAPLAKSRAHLSNGGRHVVATEVVLRDAHVSETRQEGEEAHHATECLQRQRCERKEVQLVLDER